MLNSKRGKKLYIFFIFILIAYLLGKWFYDNANLLFNFYNNLLVYAPYDAAEINQTIWNTAKGRFFQVTASMTPTDAILAQKKFNFLISHWNIIFLLVSLLYLILPHLSSLIISQCLFISASGAGLYLLAREISTEKKFLPFLILFIYIRYYPLTWISYFLHQETFCIIFLFLTLYFYLKDNLKFILIFSILSILCREEIALQIALLGIISYFVPKKRKYYLLLTLLGVLSFIAIGITRLIISTNYKEFVMYNHLNTHYGYLGETFLDKFKNMVFHPSLALSLILNPVKISIIKNTLGFLLYVPFLSPLFLMPGLLILVELMLSQNPNVGTLRWGAWYFCLLIPFMFMALTITFEKIYNLDKFMIKTFPKILYNKKLYSRLIKAVSIAVILFLSFSIYAKNTKFTKLDKSALSGFLSIKKYWHEDTFGIMSAVKEKAKVICAWKLLPTLSAREYIIAIHWLTKEIADKGVFDIVFISEDGGYTHLDKYELVKNSPNYKEIYSTPYIKVLIKEGIPRSDLIDDWKFELISNIKSSSIDHNYIFSDFIDFSTILENSDIMGTSDLLSDSNINREIYYVSLEPQLLRRDTISLSLNKPLETGYGYMLAFVAKANKDFGSLFIEGLGEDDGPLEIRMDNKSRIYVLPFRVNKFHGSYNFLLWADSQISFSKDPILLRFPLGESEDITKKSVFQVDIGRYKFSYNPWLDKNSCGNIKNIESAQLLIKDKNIYANPLIYFMKLLKLPIPIDLYKYSWESAGNMPLGTEIKAIRY